MATATAANEPACDKRSNPPPSGQSRVDVVIDARIAEAAAALWRAEVIRSMLQMVIAVAVTLAAWVVMDHWIYSPTALVRLLALAVVVFGAIAYLVIVLIPLVRSKIRPEYAARSLERDLPQLRQGLVSYVMLRGASDGDELRGGMIRSLGAQTAGRLGAHDHLPSEAMGTFRWWLAALACVVLLIGYAILSPKDTLQSARRLVTPLAPISAPKRVSITEVTPGDAETLSGRAVAVSANIRGLGVDESAIIHWQSSGQPHQSSLQPESDGRLFKGTIELDHFTTGEVRYEIRAGDGVAGPYRLHVKDVPVIVSQSVFHRPPRYTGEEPYHRSGGAVSAVSGTVITLSATTNRAVAKAKIEFNPRPLGDSVSATAGVIEMQIHDNGTDVSSTFPLRSSRGRAAAVELDSYRIQVWDDSGQTSPDPIVYPIRVVEDLPPEVTIVIPQTTPKDVPIDAQQAIEVHAIDPDYGLATIELELRRGIDVLANPVLWRSELGASGNQVAEYRFRPTDHSLRVGDVISITALASDNRVLESDPSVEPNYSQTDAIQLRITMGEAPRVEPDRNDGLSKPDKRPATEQKSDGDQSGEQEQNGGGSGAGGKSGSKQQGDGQQGDGQQSDVQQSDGQQSDGPSGEESSGDGKSSSKQTGDGTSETGSSESGESSEMNQGEKPGASSDSSNPANSQPGTKAEPNRDGDATSGKPSDSPQNGEASPNDTGDAQPGTQAANKNAANKNTANKNTAKQNGTSAEGSDAADADGENSSKQSSESASEGTSSAEQSPDSGAGSSAKPQHDGEAFERIQKYLNDQQKKNQQENGGSSPPKQNTDGPEPSDGQQPGSEASDNDTQGQAKSGDRKSNPGNDQSAASANNTKQQPESGAAETDQPAGRKSPATSETDGKQANGSEQSPGEKMGGDQTGNEKSGEGESSQAESEKGELGNNESGKGETDDGASGSSPHPDGSKSKAKGATTSERSQAKAGQQHSQESTPKPSSESSAKNPPGGDNQPGGDSAGAGQRDGSPSGDSAGDGSGDTKTPVDAPDLEYTQRATDMVLDYLKETRDKPDRELLKRLDWTEQEMQEFQQRWQSLRESAGDFPIGENERIREALESLGMRPGEQATSDRALEQDALRGLRDSGTRRPPPAAFRDAFDAFRRAASRQE